MAERYYSSNQFLVFLIIYLLDFEDWKLKNLLILYTCLIVSNNNVEAYIIFLRSIINLYIEERAFLW